MTKYFDEAIKVRVTNKATGHHYKRPLWVIGEVVDESNVLHAVVSKHEWGEAHSCLDYRKYYLATVTN